MKMLDILVARSLSGGGSGGGGGVIAYGTADYSIVFENSVDQTSAVFAGFTAGNIHTFHIDISCHIYQQISNFDSFPIATVTLPSGIAPQNIAANRVLASKIIPDTPYSQMQNTEQNSVLLAVWNGTGIDIILKSNGFTMGSTSWYYSQGLDVTVLI